MPDKIGILNDKYFGASGYDLRDSKEFKAFKKEVLAFIKAEKSVTWRRLNWQFPAQGYWLTMAVELLEGQYLTVESNRIPERIVAK